MNKVRKNAGVPAPDIRDIACAVAAGQTGEICRLSMGDIPCKQQRKLRKRLNASKTLQLDQEIVWNAAGISVDAIASWQGRATVEVKEMMWRFRILVVDSKRTRMVYAIPAAQVGNLKSLPLSGFSTAEVQLLEGMANEISGKEADRNFYLPISHPAQQTVNTNKTVWDAAPSNGGALLSLLHDRQWVLPVVTAALDAQLRSFKKFRDVPANCYNFITCSGDAQADETFITALRSVSFAGEGIYRGAAPPEIIIKEAADLKAWHGCIERVAILRTSTGSLLTTIFDEIDERERIRYCGGILPPPLQTVPILRCKSVLHRTSVINTEIPKGESLLSGAEQDILRAAMAKSLTHKCAQAAYDRWRMWMSEPASYRFDGRQLWCEALVRTFLLEVAGTDGALREAVETLLSDSQVVREATERERDQVIARAIDLIAHPERFSGDIIDRPRSKAEACSHLNEEQDAVAFRFRPTRGNDVGCQFLAFSADSLRRLLQRVNCRDELFEAVLARAEKIGLLDQSSRTIKLGSDSFTAITFFLKKC